jgi:hypothetical protein
MGTPVPDIATKLAVLNLLLDFKDAAAGDDLKAAKDCYNFRLTRARGVSRLSADENEAVQRVFDLSGRWLRGSDGTTTAKMVQTAVNRAIALLDKSIMEEVNRIGRQDKP